MPKSKKKRKKSLGIVPKALLGAAIAGAVPASIVPACSSGCSSDQEFAVDANNPPDRPFFAVDANIQHPDGPEFSVDAPSSDGAES